MDFILFLHSCECKFSVGEMENLAVISEFTNNFQFLSKTFLFVNVVWNHTTRVSRVHYLVRQNQQNYMTQ